MSPLSLIVSFLLFLLFWLTWRLSRIYVSRAEREELMCFREIIRSTMCESRADGQNTKTMEDIVSRIDKRIEELDHIR